jgi:hypothetical protein
MDQWKADAQIQGLKVSYTVTGSPDGLTAFKASTVDFAGTEAEFSSLLAGTGEQDVPRGFQYIPDVAGAVAVMYNVDDRAGNKVTSLRLSRRTIARIFMGRISKWSDPANSADNGGIKLPDQNIGYSPLPPNLSQEIANSIARMYGDRGPERLTAANCANPRFRGGSLPLSPAPPPVGNAGSGTTGGTAGSGGGPGGTGAAAGSGAGATAATAAGAGDDVAAGREGATEAVGGGSGDWCDADPVAYDRPGLKPLGLPPLVVLLLVLAIPPLVVGAVRWLRRPRF